MEPKVTLLVLLSLFVVISAVTAVPLAEATCTTGSVSPRCALPGSGCGAFEPPRRAVPALISPRGRPWRRA